MHYNVNVAVQNKPACRLINPAKSEIGRISKQLLENINTTIRRKTGLNQWKNSTSVINWFSSIQDKHQHTFAVFDIENFYPSITEKLLTDAITFAKQHTSITDRDTSHRNTSMQMSKITFGSISSFWRARVRGIRDWYFLSLSSFFFFRLRFIEIRLRLILKNA